MPLKSHRGMTALPRSQIIQPSDTVILRSAFSVNGELRDTDVFPTVTIVQPAGGVAVGPTSAGVAKIGTGQYEFRYDVGLFPPVGTWRDIWRGAIDGFEVIGEYTFTVYTTQVPAINTDGYKHLGDDPGFNFSQTAICNINNLLKTLNRRLKNKGKRRTTDEYGNVVYKDCDVFSDDELVTFLCDALAQFNEIPHFTYFTYDDTPIIEEFHHVIMQGALYMALASQALIERGREWQVQDNGIGFTPPTMSEMLNTQYQKELDNWYDRVKLIKHNCKPSPYGLGTLRFLGVAPQARRLRHLRQRQVY